MIDGVNTRAGGGCVKIEGVGRENADLAEGIDGNLSGLRAILSRSSRFLFRNLRFLFRSGRFRLRSARFLFRRGRFLSRSERFLSGICGPRDGSSAWRFEN